MRLLWTSNAPWCATGYGTQTALFAPRLAALGHDVFISAFFGIHGHATSWEGIPVLPGGQHDFGDDILAAHARAVRADLVITLMDTFMLQQGCPGGQRVLHWMPADCDPLSALDARHLGSCGGQVLAMSEHGERVLRDAGHEPLALIPHGADLAVFRPPRDRDALREELGFTGRFVIGINAANKDPLRKGLAEQVAAFAAFREQCPQALLVLHALEAAPGMGIHLGELAAALGLSPEHVRFSDPYLQLTGSYTAGHMAAWYGACDVVSNCAWGEGFGLAALEAQACGTPVITTDGPVMRELAGPGWLVPGERHWHPQHRAWWTRPSVPVITSAYADALEGAAGRRGQARRFAEAFDADVITTQKWKPLLERCEAALT